MIIFTTSNKDKELAEIVTLQQQNLPVNLTINEMQEQGFVIVALSLADLKKINQFEQNLIMK